MRSLVVALLLCVSLPAAAAPLRVFVVNPRVELRYAATYADYRDKMFALVDGQDPRRAELVQPGVLDIAAHLPPRDASAPPNALIVFPEDVGLVAGLIGSRGAAARKVTLASGGSTAAFFALNVAYGSLAARYTQQFPGLGGLGYLFLAETDTYYRAVYETFRDMAVTYNVYVAASVNASAARRIDAADDASLVATLRDPDEPQRDYAYEAVGGRPVNTLFVFAPDGSILVSQDGETRRSPGETGGVLRGSLDKAYLTEVEQDPLGLVGGAVSGLDVLDTPIGRLASVTSKDAWMVDVNDRYDAKRPQIVIQPEAFDQWAFVADPWAPDGFKAGGFAQVQRNPSFLFNLTPSLVGNLFDVTFDGQGAVIGKRSKASDVGSLAWIGQQPDNGFLDIAPWIAADPGGADIASRRNALVALGRKLLPGSAVPCATPNGSGACENGYRESVQMVDLDIPVAGSAPARTPGARVPAAFGTAQFIDPNAAGEQRHPHVAAAGRDVYVVWQDARDGRDAIYLAVSRDAGAHFASKRVSADAASARTQWRPAVAYDARRGTLFVAWQELCADNDDACGAIELARFDRDGNQLGETVRVDDAGDGVGKWNVALALDRGGNPLLAWVDERDTAISGGAALPLEHIYFARSRDRGLTFAPNVRVDRGKPSAFAAALDNKWAPSIAVRPPFIHVAWADFRNYQWDIYTTRSRDGRYFERSVRVDDGVSERINDHPAIAVASDGTVNVAWADRRRQDPDTNIRVARSTSGGRRFEPSQQIDAGGADSNQWFPAVALDESDVLVAWQDNRLGDNDIFVARSRDSGGSFDPDQRADDSGSDPSEQTRPSLTIDPTTRTAWLVWEDERNGPAAIAIAARAMD